MAHAQGALQDAHILELTKRITNDEQLTDLGVNVLKLPIFKIQSALFDKKEIRPAAVLLFTEWKNKQDDMHEAYNTLCRELQANDMKDLAVVLKQAVEGLHGDGPISEKRFETIQYLTRRSLSGRPFCLIPNKDWTSRPSNVELKKIYTDLLWSTKTREPSGTKRQTYDDYESLLKEMKLGEELPVRVLVQGEGGMGKTTASKHMAMSWADNTSDVLGRFQITFHIALNKVKADTPIENVIIEQHCELESNNVKPDEIKNILEGNSTQKILVIVDGHDEYKVGTNSEIDKFIMKRKLGSCSLVLTSRETEEIEKIKDFMDVEADIQGFKSPGVKKYIEQSLGSTDLSEELLMQAESNELCHSDMEGGYIFNFGFLQIPIFLNMFCVLFKSKIALPKTKTGILKGMTTRFMDREDSRRGQASKAKTKSVLVKLGKLAWSGLLENRIIFSREEVVRVAGEEALELGLLIGTEDPDPAEEEQAMFCFQHLLFQEFVAAHYIAQLPKEMLETLFSKWGCILQQQGVLIFACVLSDDTEKILEIIYESLITYLKPPYDLCAVTETILKSKSSGNIWCKQFLQALEKELSEKLNIDAFHNKYFNHTTTDDPKLFVPSRFYVFDDDTPPRQSLNFLEEDTLKCSHTQCSIIVTKKTSLLHILNILQYLQTLVQITVGWIHLENITDDFEHRLLKKSLKFGCDTYAVSLVNVTLSQPTLKYIMHQMSLCNNLTGLSLFGIKGVIPMELGKSIATISSLKGFWLDSCEMTPVTAEDLMLALSKCLSLEFMTIKGVNIKGKIVHFCGGPGHPGFKSLMALYLEGLNRQDSDNLAHAMDRNRFAKLSSLRLESTVLSDSLKDVMFHRDKMQDIDGLFLLDCSLTPDDVKNVFDVFGSLNNDILDLSQNVLSGFVGTECSTTGLASSRQLILQRCGLVEKDIEQISSAIANGKLPKLKVLDLLENDLQNLKARVKDLVQACTSYYQDRLFSLHLSVNNWPNEEEKEEFMGSIDAMCKYSGVHIKWNTSSAMYDERFLQITSSFPPGLFESQTNLDLLALRRLIENLTVDNM